jgi:hypothetical protein
VLEDEIQVPWYGYQQGRQPIFFRKNPEWGAGDSGELTGWIEESEGAVALGKSVRFYCEVCGADLTDKATALFQQELERMDLSVRDLYDIAVRNLKGEDIEGYLEGEYDITQRIGIEVIGRQLLYITFGVLVCNSCNPSIEKP